MMVETSYREELKEKSIGYIEKLQDGSSEATAKTWEFYSNFGIAAALAVPPFVFFFIQWKRLKAL